MGTHSSPEMIGLVRIRCERRYRNDIRDLPKPDYRQFDVPPGDADSIANQFAEWGWEVTKEDL